MHQQPDAAAQASPMMSEARSALVVDDSQAVLDLVSRILAAAGFDVAAHSRFEEARAYLRTAAPDIIVTDVRLGSFNGLQLVLQARERRPDICALVISGFNDPVLREEAARYGAPFLLKPFSADELLAAVEGLLGKDARG
jgi:DNA-binding response OmpR family regulator